ncbi:hypothetical protein Bca52824_028437 [Brassica carinata]|uniref:Autophagy-related protein 9 n=1 Tax=Brassica carinata TaxID=52824 RepID=A0A8X7VCQ4_BRACI|nr:hypothetical protein Bca52824_028437 [Brassica carinata]
MRRTRLSCPTTEEYQALVARARRASQRESLNVQPIADLDLFQKLYSYYRDKGLWCIIVKWAVELLSLGFIICFSGFFLLFFAQLKDTLDFRTFITTENYLIGILNKGLLSFPISHWIPGAGPLVKSSQDGTQQHHLVLTKTLEWTLNCNFRVRRDFVSNPETLKKRLFVVGLAMLLLSPFLVIFVLVYLFLRHAEQFYNHPSTASSRRWSNLSRWLFREFNEVDHLFKHRINSSAEHASQYLNQFPSPIISIVAKFVSFVSGGFAAVLIIIAFLEESLLEGHIFGRNLFWYAAVFGAITAISRAAISMNFWSSTGGNYGCGGATHSLYA